MLYIAELVLAYAHHGKQKVTKHCTKSHINNGIGFKNPLLLCTFAQGYFALVLIPHPEFIYALPAKPQKAFRPVQHQ
jgi:hypothetical protein